MESRPDLSRSLLFNLPIISWMSTGLTSVPPWTGPINQSKVVRMPIKMKENVYRELYLKQHICLEGVAKGKSTDIPMPTLGLNNSVAPNHLAKHNTPRGI